MSVRVVLLGTNGWYDSDMGGTISILVELPDAYVVFDAGFGINKLEKFASLKKPGWLVLSHLHVDHVAGLHVLGKIKCFTDLNIVVEKNYAPDLRALTAPPFMSKFASSPYPVEIIEADAASASGCALRGPGFDLVLKPLRHSVPCIGARIDCMGVSAAYVADTGYCEGALALSRNADILLAECAYGPGQVNENWPHLNPETAAKIAADAGAKKLVLVHFDAERYQTIDDRKTAQRAAMDVFSSSIAGFDGMEFIL
jgi:ribonuclease BN (tRNA processing enzyme)